METKYILKQQNGPTKHIVFKICLKGNLRCKKGYKKLTAQLTGFTACGKSKMGGNMGGLTTKDTIMSNSIGKT